MLQLWEVLWAHSWLQRRLCNQPATASAAAVGQHAPADSPGKDSSHDSLLAVPADSLVAGQEEGSKTGAAAGPAGSRMQVVADSRGASTDGKGDGQPGKGSSVVTDKSSFQQQPHLELFICFVAAIVQAQRRTLLDHCYNADDVLRLFHGVRRVDLWQCLDKARLLLDALHSK